MARYVPCYSCDMARNMFRVLDVNDDGDLDWIEMELRASWALMEYETKIGTSSL